MPQAECKMKQLKQILKSSLSTLSLEPSITTSNISDTLHYQESVLQVLEFLPLALYWVRR